MGTSGAGKIDAIRTPWRPVAGARPVAFFNYRETVLPGDAGRNWEPIGAKPGGLQPDTAEFTAISAHANGNPRSSLETGLRLINAGKAPLVVALEGLRRPLRVRIPPGGRIDVPCASVSRHPDNGKLRDGSRTVVFNVSARVVSGDPAGLRVEDIVRFPQAAETRRPAGPPAPVPLHHEGVFLPQRQATDPVLLSPGTAAYIRIAGSNRNHDAHYYAEHRALIALPAGNPPKAVVFRGPGGYTRPKVGSHRLPALGRREFTLPLEKALRDGYLVPTGGMDRSGNPVYAVSVRFQAGDNGDLHVLGRW
ncbi:MAG: hypothetical protein FJZ00_10555 [Candidatus Sericytochromatia bacterium]|uniref:Uncharacterized protein n=1 Tax=Candidatus Tanganyikabacteria bacterium TaxID=2961651 RepID=A0A938BLR9_9BACT|nr:hypothetical protein [Candidatus Tanganyikabacteria bacterium]